MVLPITRKLQIILLVLMSPVLHAGDTFIDVHLVSNHIAHTFSRNGKNIDYNERNKGLGITKQYSESWELKAGFFENSHYRTSIYAGVQPFIYYNNIKLGAMVALATGYEGEDRAVGIPIGKVNLIALPNISINIYKNNFISLGILPGKLTTLTYQYRL